jgi:hypothetical protein
VLVRKARCLPIQHSKCLSISWINGLASFASELLHAVKIYGGKKANRNIRTGLWSPPPLFDDRLPQETRTVCDTQWNVVCIVSLRKVRTKGLIVGVGGRQLAVGTRGFAALTGISHASIHHKWKEQQLHSCDIQTLQELVSRLESGRRSFCEGFYHALSEISRDSKCFVSRRIVLH